MMGALFAQVKLYLFGALLLAGGFAYWYHGHVEYNAGKVAGDQEVLDLQDQYASAYASAQSAARAMQAQVDAQAIADANRRAQSSAFQLSIVTATAQTAQAQADDFAAKLKEALKHDPAVNALLDTRLPDSVRAAGEGGSG